MRGRSPSLTLVVAAAVILVVSGPVSAYLKLGTRIQNRTVTLKWNRLPIRYFVSNQGVPNVSATDFQRAVTRAFTTWNAVDTASTSSEFAGFTPAPPFSDDGMVVIGYQGHPELERTLAATTFMVDVTDGEIVEADIFFNTAGVSWSTATAGEAGRFDVESIALHEIGHLHGLGHSALGETEVSAGGGRRVLGAEAVMFPIAFSAGSIADRVLRADDIAGISDIYPRTGAGSSSARLGSISGTVTKNGAGVFGAHIVAYDPSTGALVGGFSLNNDGAFTIAGLESGTYVLRAEPLDDGDVESFFDNSANVDLNFGVRFHDRVAVVPRGGGTGNVGIKVTPK